MRNLTTDEFKTMVMDYTQKDHKFIGKTPVIVKFTAPWCGPCKMMDPVLEKLEEEFNGKVSIYNLNIDDEYEPAAAFGIRSIPNMIFFPSDGGEPERMVGAYPKKNVKEAIQRVFKL